MPSRNRYVTLVGVVALLVLLYSVLILSRPLAGFLPILFLLMLYLAWRFVRAVERIADALED